MKCRDCLHAVMCVEYAKLHGIENIQELLEHEGSDVCRHFMKASDVVEVVRCGRCKHKRIGRNSFGVYFYCGHPSNGLTNIGNVDKDFCSYGERRNDVEQG